ncbi:DUF4124 domain-containing protein [Ketobacter sp.]|uniref:DUF4124 domain-containing protein n=1 Tax=Ketobacter sp. TaxID=2083498 RepID=UPI000F242CA9|nr:DUF4124 domain-containing protein [Ketobacter sp.]RLU01857.1 MAG: DUF4124 domain-containing protein [Ketobacter sp.]
MIRTPVILTLLALVAVPATAETVYKYKDASGNTVFTDEPTEGAEKMDVQPVPTIPAIIPKIDTAPVAAPEDDKFSYNKMTIIIPSDGEHFINNGGQVTVQVAVSPNLRNNDKVQLVFNGVPYGKPQRATTFNISNLDRGEYVAHVSAIDNHGKEVGKSDSITFYVKRSAVAPTLAPAPKPAPRKSP